MAGYKQKGMNFGKGTGYTGNPGDKWNETWNAPDYNENYFTLQRYGLGHEDTKVSKMAGTTTRAQFEGGKNRVSNLPEYTRDKVENRSEVLVERQINKLNRREDKIESVQGSDITKRQRRLLGKGKTERAMKIAARKARRQKRRNARNN